MAHWWHMHFARQCWVSVASTARIRLVRLAPGSLQALSWELTKPKVARERNHAKAERAWREQQRDAAPAKVHKVKWTEAENDIVREAMENPFRWHAPNFKMKVPLCVDYGIGKSWADAKP